MTEIKNRKNFGHSIFSPFVTTIHLTQILVLTLNLRYIST